MDLEGAKHEKEILRELRSSVQEDDLQQVAHMLNEYPHIISNQPSIVLEAMNENMVWTLLQLKLPQNLTFKCVPGTDCQGLSTAAATQFEFNIKSSNVQCCFPFVIKKWKNVARTILDNCIFMEGHGHKDPQLTVNVTFSLFCEEQSNNFKLESLLALNDDPEQNEVLLSHPTVKVFATHHETKNILKRLLYLAIGITVLSTYTIYLEDTARHEVCPKYIENFTAQVAWFSAYVLVWFINLCFEVSEMLILRLNYFKDSYNLFQWIQIIVTPLCMITTFLDNDSFLYVTLIALLLVWSNIALSFRNSRLIGKYLLMFTQVSWTFLQIAMPFTFVLFVLSMGGFCIYYEQVFAAEVQQVFQEEPQLRNICTSAFYSGEDEPFDDAWPTLWEMQYSAKLMLTNFNALLSNVNVQNGTQVGGSVVATNALYFSFSTVLVAILLMNLLVGLTVRDIDYMAAVADAKIVALELKQIFEASAPISALGKTVACCKREPPKAHIVLFINKRQSSVKQLIVNFLQSTLPEYTLQTDVVHRQIRDLAKTRFQNS